MNPKKGLLYVFEGDGKGKTSAALGVAVRMLSLGKKVVWISWFKSLEWPISESRLPKYFGSKLKMYWMGKGFFIKSEKSKKLAGGAVAMDKCSQEDHLKAARKGLALALKKLKQVRPPELLILDELIRAVSEGLLTEREVIELIKNRGTTHLVVTGHRASKEILKEADLVTKMEKVKHPYDKQRLAVRGLDY
jgi:cob(I)alamin adenosyltransferase